MSFKFLLRCPPAIGGSGPALSLALIAAFGLSACDSTDAVNTTKPQAANMESSSMQGQSASLTPPAADSAGPREWQQTIDLMQKKIDRIEQENAQLISENLQLKKQLSNPDEAMEELSQLRASLASSEQSRSELETEVQRLSAEVKQARQGGQDVESVNHLLTKSRKELEIAHLQLAEYQEQLLQLESVLEEHPELMEAKASTSDW